VPTTYTTAEINAALVHPRRRWRFKYFIVDTTSVYETKDVVECRVQCNYLAQGANRTCDVVFGPNVEFDQLRQAFRVEAQLVMPPVVITDDFQGVTNADMNGRPTTTGGKTWVANGGTWSIFGNGGRHSNTTPGNITVDTGEADGTWQIDFYTATDLAYSGIRFRDNGGGQNYQLKTDGSTWHFQHDGITDIGVTAPGTVTTNTWYYLRVVLAGHRVKIYINDVLTFDHTGTDVNYTTGTRVGLQAFNATTPLWDNFRWVGVADGLVTWTLGTFRLSASTLRVAGAPDERPQKLDGEDTRPDRGADRGELPRHRERDPLQPRADHHAPVPRHGTIHEDSARPDGMGSRHVVAADHQRHAGRDQLRVASGGPHGLPGGQAVRSA
jgi:hypothetical protein